MPCVGAWLHVASSGVKREGSRENKAGQERRGGLEVRQESQTERKANPLVFLEICCQISQCNLFLLDFLVLVRTLLSITFVWDYCFVGMNILFNLKMRKITSSPAFK